MEWSTVWLHECSNFSALPFKMNELTEIVQMTLNENGEALRFELTNLYGKQDILFDEINLSTDKEFHVKQQISFQRQRKVIIKHGSKILTDPVQLRIIPGMKIFLQLISKKPQEYMDFASTYDTSETNAIIVRKADVKAKLSKNNSARHGWFCLRRAEILTRKRAKKIAIVGDSLAEMGYISSELAEVFRSDYPGEITVLNYGVSGQRLLNNAPQDEPLFTTFGMKVRENVKTAIDDGVDLIVIISGLNDLVLPLFSKQAANQVVNEHDLFDEIRYLIDFGRESAKIIVCSITPFEIGHGKEIHTKLMEQNISTRLKFNKLLRKYCTNTLIDSASLMGDIDQLRLQKKYDLGDHLHINKEGGAMVAQEIFNKAQIWLDF